MSLREVLYPAQWLYQGVTSVRNWFYDRSFLKTNQVNAKVICVGNVTMGGTGKTPITMALLEHFGEKGLRCGVVSRGYKRDQRGVFDVQLEPKSAYTFGDEPALIKSTFPSVPVVVGERRADAARALLESNPVDVILCDDGFQHRRLHRDLNLLLLDAMEPRENYRVIPVGRARERFTEALRRADFLVVTKSNLISEEAKEGFVNWVKEKADRPMLFANYTFGGMRNLSGERVNSLRDKVYLVTGVAKPGTVEQLLEGHVEVVKHRQFADHHRYADIEIEQILDESSHLQARWILTTAKDSMKLSAFPRIRERLWILDLKIEWKGDVPQFYESLDRLARPSH